MSAERRHERWIWTELIAFDNTRPDLGVAEYLNTAGFTPYAICLLIGSPDFVLSHEDRDDEFELSPEYCSRDGHEFNQQRGRQVWTNRQLQALIAELHRCGIQCYLTVFTAFYQNKYHHEWASDHPEARHVTSDLGRVDSVDPLGQLTDGTLFEDYFTAQLVKTLSYYGFDGWHGADGWGPHPGALDLLSFSDGVMAQFAAWLERPLPEEVAAPGDTDPARATARATWILRHERRAWIDFNVTRWEQFWRKVMTALHGAGKQAIINNAWTRPPLEAIYRYGVDYQRIVAAGVDGIVPETVVAGLAMDPRPGAAIPARHYDFLAMLLLIRACVPETRLIFLHNTQDVVEEWDAIRHQPALLEREIYALSNLFLLRADGRYVPAADGFLVCLGDGMDRDQWNWLREKWHLAYGELPRRVLGVTLVWSDAAFDRSLEDYLESRGWPLHRLLYELMARGVPVQSAVNIHDLAAASGPLLVLNDHQLPPAELETLRAYSLGPVVMIGRGKDGLFEDVYPQARLSCRVWGAEVTAPEIPPAPEPEPLPPDPGDWPEPKHYWDDLVAYPVSAGFLQACADLLLDLCGPPRVVDAAQAVTLMATEQPDGKLRIALKNQTPIYARPTVEIGRSIREVRVLTVFPAVAVCPEGSRFEVRVPGHGVTVVEVTLA